MWNNRARRDTFTSKQVPLETWHVKPIGTMLLRVANAGDDSENFLCMFCGRQGCDLLMSMANAELKLRKLMGLHRDCAEVWGAQLEIENDGDSSSVGVPDGGGDGS